jgi:hypothetical protein
MLAFRKSMVAANLLLALAGGAYAASDRLKGSTDEQLKTLAAIQPGLGTVTIEYANRYSDIYHAAKGGNWPLAAYHSRKWAKSKEVGDNAPRTGRCPEGIRAILPLIRLKKQ